MSPRLISFKGVIRGILRGPTVGVIKGVATSLGEFKGMFWLLEVPGLGLRVLGLWLGFRV